jgi:hypothetical protein
MTSVKDYNGNSSSIENSSIMGEEKVNKAKNTLGVQEKEAPPALTPMINQLLMTLGYRPKLRRNFSTSPPSGNHFGL